MSGKVIKTKEEKDASKVMDDAPPGTQEYIMLRQDSIQSTELKKKESPFRAKCHEIFCCPLKQVHLKENTEPEVVDAKTQEPASPQEDPFARRKVKRSSSQQKPQPPPLRPPPWMSHI